MTNTIKHFKCGDTEYPLAFTMNVIEKIQDNMVHMKNGEI